MVKQIEDYPMILTAAHLSEILSVSKPTAYEIMKQPNFPLIELGGRNKRVLKEAFFEWLISKGIGKSVS